MSWAQASGHFARGQHGQAQDRTVRLADVSALADPLSLFASQVESSLPGGAPRQVPVTPEYGSAGGQMGGQMGGGQMGAPPANSEVDTPFGA